MNDLIKYIEEGIALCDKKSLLAKLDGNEKAVFGYSIECQTLKDVLSAAKQIKYLSNKP